MYHLQNSVRVTSEIFNDGKTFETPYGVIFNADILVLNTSPSSDSAQFTVLPRGNTYLVDVIQQGTIYVMTFQDVTEVYFPAQFPAKWDGKSWDSYYYGYLIHPTATTWGGPWHIQADLTPRPSVLKCQRKPARAWRTTPKVQAV